MKYNYRFRDVVGKRWITRKEALGIDDIEMVLFERQLGTDVDGIPVFENDIIEFDVKAWYTGEEYDMLKEMGEQPWFWRCRTKISKKEDLDVLNANLIGNVYENPEIEIYGYRVGKDGKHPYPMYK